MRNNAPSVPQTCCQSCIGITEQGQEGLPTDPDLSGLAETKEYVGGALRIGDRPSGKEFAAHLDSVHATLPPTVKTVLTTEPKRF